MADARRTEIHRGLHNLFNVGTVAGLPDSELLERFVAGRGESAELAFAALVERHGTMVLRVCRKVLPDAQDAADAFQATFLVLARKAGSIRRRDTLGPYLHGVALRVASCARSAHARRRRHERSYAERAPTSYETRLPDDLGCVLHEELGRLPERFRGVAVLCDLEGKTYVEAAGLLGCPPGTVMSRLAEARRRLRGRLARRGLAPSTGAFAAVLAAESKATAKLLPGHLVESTIQAATRFAAGPLASATSTATATSTALALTEGVLKAMFLSKLKSIAIMGLVGGVVAAGAGVLAQGPAIRNDPAETSGGPAVVTSDLDRERKPEATPADKPVSTPPPSDDRLKSLEEKLDRLLNALEADATDRPSRKGLDLRRRPQSASTLPPGGGGMAGFGMDTTKTSQQRPQTAPTPSDEMMPGMTQMMMPGMMPGRTPGRQPGMEAGMMPGMMSGMMPGMMPGKDFESRLQRVEQQLKAYGDRLARLEQAALTGEAGKRTSAPNLDALDPNLRPLRAPATRHEPETSSPSDFSPAPVTDAKPANENSLLRTR